MALPVAGIGIGLGIASTALSFLGQSSADKAQAQAVRQRNAAIERSAYNTRNSQRGQQALTFGRNKSNIVTQNQAMIGAIVNTSASRGILGSRTAQTLKDNQMGQAGLAWQDEALNNLFANKQIDINFANTMNQRGGYQGQSMGLSLLGAGLSGLQTGMSAYGAADAINKS